MNEKILSVPYIDQTKRWPTGCESVSAVMLLQYLGIEIDVDTFISCYLECGEVKKDSDGNILMGPDPRKAFVGSPYDVQSMGCYAPVIVEALNRVFEERKKDLPQRYLAADLTGVSVQRLLSEYTDQRMPVIFWSTLDGKPYIPGPSWTMPDGGVFAWRSNEHCMLLVGYGEGKLYFNDPWQGHGCTGYDRSLVELRHGEMYSMTVSVTAI